MRCQLKPVRKELNNRGVALDILIVDKHINDSLSYRNWFKHMPFKTIF